MNELLGALVFASIVYLAIEICRGLPPPLERSARARAEALRVLLCAAAASAGAIVLAHRAPPDTLLALAELWVALCASCYLAIFRGNVAPVVPGTALAVLVAAAMLTGDLGPLVSAGLAGAPFALTALFAREGELDWGDSTVAALGGAAFGLALSLVLLAVACLAALAVRAYLQRRGAEPSPTRFASALATTFLVVLLGKLAVS
jgi:hypothetical protein